MTTDPQLVMGETLAERARPVRLYSHLYSRLNGFMLGMFFEMSWRKPARRRYGFYRERMRTFLREVGIEDTPPRSHAEAVDRYDRGFLSLSLKLGERAVELRDFFHLGVFSLAAQMLGPGQRSDRDDMRAFVADTLPRYCVPAARWDEIPSSPRSEPRDMFDLVSHSLAFLVDLIQPLPAEPKTCFVAMPFREPFERRYRTFYRPLLTAAGYRPIRAWGGFADEDFAPLLVSAILKSGALLADVTGWSRNVIWEVGVAHGAGKPVFLLRDDADAERMSDLARHLTLRYTSRDLATPALLVMPIVMIKNILAVLRARGDRVRLAGGARSEDFKAYGSYLVDGVRRRGSSQPPQSGKRRGRRP